MALITWQESFNTGDITIDNQHRRLVAILNRVHEGMAQGAATELLAPSLTELDHYTRLHFTHEEGLMKQIGYPNLAAHKKEHEDLLVRLRALREELESGKVALSIRVLQFLKHWLERHILGSDQAYAPYLRSTPDCSLAGSRR